MKVLVANFVLGIMLALFFVGLSTCSEGALARGRIKTIYVSPEIWEVVKEHPIDIRHTLLSIGMVESGLRNIVGESGEDFGVWQVHLSTLERLGISPVQVIQDLKLQVDIVFGVLYSKTVECGKRYPNSWIACYHSATKDKHYAYLKRLTHVLTHYRFLKGDTNGIKKEEQGKKRRIKI